MTSIPVTKHEQQPCSTFSCWMSAVCHSVHTPLILGCYQLSITGCFLGTSVVNVKMLLQELLGHFAGTPVWNLRVCIQVLYGYFSTERTCWSLCANFPIISLNTQLQGFYNCFSTAVIYWSVCRNCPSWASLWKCNFWDPIGIFRSSFRDSKNAFPLQDSVNHY